MAHELAFGLGCGCECEDFRGFTYAADLGSEASKCYVAGKYPGYSMDDGFFPVCYLESGSLCFQRNIREDLLNDSLFAYQTMHVMDNNLPFVATQKSYNKGLVGGFLLRKPTGVKECWNFLPFHQISKDHAWFVGRSDFFITGDHVYTDLGTTRINKNTFEVETWRDEYIGQSMSSLTNGATPYLRFLQDGSSYMEVRSGRPGDAGRDNLLGWLFGDGTGAVGGTMSAANSSYAIHLGNHWTGEYSHTLSSTSFDFETSDVALSYGYDGGSPAYFYRDMVVGSDLFGEFVISGKFLASELPPLPQETCRSFVFRGTRGTIYTLSLNGQAISPPEDALSVMRGGFILTADEAGSPVFGLAIEPLLQVSKPWAPIKSPISMRRGRTLSCTMNTLGEPTAAFGTRTAIS